MAAFVWGPTSTRPPAPTAARASSSASRASTRLVDDHVRVVAKASCMAGCSHCATLCEAGALSFPSLEELRAARARD